MSKMKMEEIKEMVKKELKVDDNVAEMLAEIIVESGSDFCLIKKKDFKGVMIVTKKYTYVLFLGDHLYFRAKRN